MGLVGGQKISEVEINTVFIEQDEVVICFFSVPLFFPQVFLLFLSFSWFFKVCLVFHCFFPCSPECSCQFFFQGNYEILENNSFLIASYCFLSLSFRFFSQVFKVLSVFLWFFLGFPLCSCCFPEVFLAPSRPRKSTEVVRNQGQCGSLGHRGTSRTEPSPFFFWSAQCKGQPRKVWQVK